MRIAGLAYCLLILFIFSFPLAAQTGPAASQRSLIVGTAQGLYDINRFGIPVPLWTGGGVRKILRSGGGWIILSDQGILASEDLKSWESRNQGLPVKTLKIYREGRKSFITQVQEIKDLEVNSEHPEIMVCATKDLVFLSRNGGRSWESLGSIPVKTNGIKAVAAAGLPELTVFLSHSTYGVYYIQPDKRGGIWTALNKGLEELETTGNPDEVSDIAASGGPGGIYVSQTFRGRIYRLDWEGKRFYPVMSDGRDFGTVDSLYAGQEHIRFVREGAVVEIPRPGREGSALPWAVFSREGRTREDIKARLDSAGGIGLKPLCAAFWEPFSFPETEPVILSELWLLDVPVPETGAPHTAEGAFGREGLYLPVGHARDAAALKPYLDVITDRKLDMVVIDMKDDYGRLRFTPESAAVAAKGRVFQPVDIDGFLKTMKERGIYTAARIVVFKDPELAGKEEGKYAIWDSRNNRPWTGYYDTRRQKLSAEERRQEAARSAYITEVFPAQDPLYEILRTYYDEHWVDPYSEEVWDYIAEVAGELHRRGFDEIQFDYIRFPTDGENLADARYRWRDPGMDMESAMLSFLRHVRSRLKAPISIDIYGANGWYRTGARTGQEVEMLSPYVDVISPMYYPSHFEQDFLAQNPPEDRPYRIYYIGVQRTARIARGRVIVRPYVQAFFLNVAYDRRYYNPEYVLREVQGVRDAGGAGLTYWNNSGRYDDIPK